MDNCGDIRVKHYVVFALEFPHSIEAFGIRSCLSLMACSLETLLSRGVGSLSSIERLSVSSFRSVNVGRPIIAGPGVSET